MNSKKRITIVGGGAAGFFAAIKAAEISPSSEVRLLEKGTAFLSKVRISGGGRCNVTHACFDPRALSTYYPRGGRALIGAFQKFQPQDTVAWFEQRGVTLKTEADGRMFPVSDSSQTIIDCFLNAAHRANVELRPKCGVNEIEQLADGTFQLTLTTGETICSDRVLLATGGARSNSCADLLSSLGHTTEEPVPSLFTFNCRSPLLRTLAGIATEHVEASIPGTSLRERGPLLITHTGLSGPVILRLSAWGARVLQGMNYRFALRINWAPSVSLEEVRATLQEQRKLYPGKLVTNTPLFGLPARLWQQLCSAAGVGPETRWAILPRKPEQDLATLLKSTELPIDGKSTNKDEFVTCGGVPLNEVNLRTMESRICPGLFFAGELLDIDGVTGGFNFQAAWTTGFIAGSSM